MMEKMLPLRVFFTSLSAALLLSALPVPVLKHAPKPEYFVYVSSGGKDGIYLYKFNPAAPSLLPVGDQGKLGISLPGVTSLAIHPGGRFLYAVTANSTVAAFAIQASGSLRLLNKVQSERKDACSITVEKKGWMILVTYCGSGSVESFRVAGDGALGESGGVQQHEGANRQPKAVAITPDNFFLFNPDLDKIFQYRFDPAKAVFWPNSPASADMKPGTHALSLIFRPDEKFAYVADETASTISVFTYDHDAGTLKLRDSLSLSPSSPAALEMDAGGKFLFAASANDGNLVTLGINRKSGDLKILGRVPSGGKKPNQIHLEPGGRFVFALDQTSSRVAMFEINSKTGFLTATPQIANVPEPTSIQFSAVTSEGIH